MAKDAKTIREELARPFAPEDLEWRIQVMSKDKTSGLAIPYVTNRAIQDRLAGKLVQRLQAVARKWEEGRADLRHFHLF